VSHAAHSAGTGHYVAYRKLCSSRAAPARGRRLLPAGHFRRYAVATRMPRGLLRRLPPGLCRATAWPGVYDLMLGLSPLRLIVIAALAEHPRNATWEVFAGELERSRFGLAHFQPRTALGHLLQHHLTTAYHREGPDMAYTVDDFMNDTYDLIIRDLATLTPEQRQSIMERMDVEDRLRGLTPAQRQSFLERMDVEERLHGLAAEERLRGLDPEVVRAWLRRANH
jgi:hypothetical protein